MARRSRPSMSTPVMPVCVAEVDGEPAEQQRGHWVRRLLGDKQRRRQAVDPGHGHAGVRRDDVLAVENHPRSRGVTGAVLSGERRSHSSTVGSPEWSFVRSCRAMSSSVGRCSSVKPAEPARPAQRFGESLVDLGRARQRFADRCGCLCTQPDAPALGQDLLRPRRRSLQHERRNVQVRRRGRALPAETYPKDPRGSGVGSP
jgi:hypothetical protein